MSNEGEERGSGDAGSSESSAGEPSIDLKEQFARAVECHHEGRVAEAESIYRLILDVAPEQPFASYMLGVIAHESGENDRALELLSQALAVKPDLIEAHNALGMVLKAQGQFDRAAASFQNALAIRPGYAGARENLEDMSKETGQLDLAFNRGLAAHQAGNLDDAESEYRAVLSGKSDHANTLHFLGLIEYQRANHAEADRLMSRALAIDPQLAPAQSNHGLVLMELERPAEALSCFNNALAINPKYPQALNNRGTALRELGRLDEALTSYSKALALDPQNVDALNNRGVVLTDLGRIEEAVESYDKALAIRPDFSKALNSRGLALQEMGRLNEALESFKKALKAAPANPETLVNAAGALAEMGRLNAALKTIDNALEIKPDYVQGLNKRGLIQRSFGRYEDALASYDRALKIEPENELVLTNRGTVLGKLGRLDEAVACYHKVIAIRPNFATAHNNLGLDLQKLGRFAEAIASFRKALAIKPDLAEAHSSMALTSQYLPGVTLKELSDVHASWDQQHGAPLRTEWLSHDNDRSLDRKLRIGFVSPDLGRHPVGYFVSRLLQHKRQNDVECICYSDRKPDDLTERLIGLSYDWMDTRGVSHAALSERIRSDKIDILIDLTGHTAENRLLVFARKPAPIQVTWAGYMGSTGLSAMDYLIADRWHVREGAEGNYTESILRLPNGYICYEPPDYVPEVGPLPFEKNGCITFGCFNNSAKINGDVVMAWAEILNAAPRSRLFLKYADMDTEAIRSRLLDQFSERKIEQSRLQIEGYSPHIELLARYNDVDIALDTFPYSGGLTTCEALWMGVPVITKPGETFASRHSLSHLSNVGVPELVATDLQGYVAKAIELANDASRLASLRAGLRERMAKSPLCDGEMFAADFTAAMQKIWKEWCSAGNGGDPASK
jgi:protein O-GlcNAc transferase